MTAAAVAVVTLMCSFFNLVKNCSCVYMCIQLTVLMDTMCVPVSLRAYLPLYLELITESPVLRDDGVCCRFFQEEVLLFSTVIVAFLYLTVCSRCLVGFLVLECDQSCHSVWVTYV